MPSNQPETDTEQARPIASDDHRGSIPPRSLMPPSSFADNHGLDELSMPKLARHLGVGTMTVYSYVDNKQDLLDQMASPDLRHAHHRRCRGLAQSDGSVLLGLPEAALAHPTLAGLLASGRVTIPAVFDILETLLAKMSDDGIAIEDAVRTFYTALTYTIGYVLWEIPRAHLQTEGAYKNQWADLISQLDPTSYPTLTGPAATVTPTVASTRQFRWGLKKVIGTGPWPVDGRNVCGPSHRNVLNLPPIHHAWLTRGSRRKRTRSGGSSPTLKFLSAKALATGVPGLKRH